MVICRRFLPGWFNNIRDAEDLEQAYRRVFEAMDYWRMGLKQWQWMASVKKGKRIHKERSAY